MNNFKDFLIEKEIIPALMKWYGISLNDNKVNNFIYRTVENFFVIDPNETDYIIENENHSFYLDTLANSYEKIVPHSHRKTMGEFFTPIHIVDYILNRVGYTVKQNIENKKIIDLSCGSGSFLTRAVKILSEKLKYRVDMRYNQDISPKQAMIIINTVKNNIYGIDINPIACLLCQINFYFTLFDLFKMLIEKEIDYEIPIFNIFNKDTFQFKFSRRYDYVVGNPPYLFIRAIPQDYRNFIENLSLKTNQGQYDYYQIFIELGIKILKENGRLGYIIPDSLLALSNRKILRKFIYDLTKIKEIYYIGPQFDEPVVSNIILTLEKESDEIKRKKNQIILKFPTKQHQTERKIQQNLIEKWDYEFLINLNENDIRILEYLNNSFPKLGELIVNSHFNIRLSRGVEIGKEGEVIFCENCQKYYSLPNKELKCPECRSNLNSKYIEKIIVKEIPNEYESNFKPFIYSMNRYKIGELKYIDMTKKGIKYKNLDIYKDRIVIRQLSQDNMICATYDDYSITSQSYYNLKVNNSSILEFNNLYLLGLLNSNLLSYFFIKSFGSYKKLFPRVLIEKLKALPLKVPETDIELKLAQNLILKIKKILKSVNKNKEMIKKLQKDSDLVVYDLFDINEKDREYITDFIKNLKNE